MIVHHGARLDAPHHSGRRGRPARAGAGGKGTPSVVAIILVVGPLFGSFITEPGAMTIFALLLGRQFYDLLPVGGG